MSRRNKTVLWFLPEIRCRLPPRPRARVLVREYDGDFFSCPQLCRVNDLTLGVGPGRSVSQGEGFSLWVDQGTILIVYVTKSGSVFENRAAGPDFETVAGLLTTVRGSRTDDVTNSVPASRRLLVEIDLKYDFLSCLDYLVYAADVFEHIGGE